jgi:hypothetical protein
MKKTFIHLCIIVLFMLCAFGIAAAGEKATQDECIAKCKEAAELIKSKGLEAALPVLNDKGGPFVWKDSYVFCIDMDKKTNIAHPMNPKLIGQNSMGMKDVNGKMFFAEFLNVATGAGSGWVDYMWPKPGEKDPSPKSTYVYRVPGMNIFLGAGIYK